MLKPICPITKKVFDCQKCRAITDDEQCPYMLRDEQTDKELRFLRKIVEREMNETKASKSRVAR